MADYCKEDKETESTTTEDWMGSSVDPPCFGQSKGFLYKCLTVTVDLQTHVSLKTPKSVSVEKPTGNSDCLLQFCFSLCERHFSGAKYSTFNMSSSLTFVGERTYNIRVLNSGNMARTGALEMHRDQPLLSLGFTQPNIPVGGTF